MSVCSLSNVELLLEDEEVTVTAGTSQENLIFYTNWFCIFPITDWHNTAIKQQFHKYFAFLSNEGTNTWSKSAIKAL